MADPKDPRLSQPGGGPPRPPLPPLPGAGPSRPPLPSAPRPPAPPLSPPISGPLPATRDLDVRARELEENKKALETKLADMEKRLMEEREKVLMATVRSKEEAALSSKVETSLKDIQDKIRRERREQELEAARAAAERRAADLERRMTEERETWMTTLKSQMAQKEMETGQIEDTFTRRLMEFERKWSEEKTRLEHVLLQKSEEIEKSKQAHAFQLEQKDMEWEKRVSAVTTARDDMARQLSEIQKKAEQERFLFQAQREERERELLLLKANQSLVEAQHKAERDRLQTEMSLLSTRREDADKAAQQQAKETERLGQNLALLEKDLTEKTRLLEIEKSETEKFRVEIGRERDAKKELEVRLAKVEKDLWQQGDEVRARYEPLLARDREALKSLEERSNSLARENEDLRRDRQKFEEDFRQWNQRAVLLESEKKVLLERFTRVREEMALQEMSLRDKLEKEYREVMERSDREHQQWAQAVMREAEQRLREQELKAQQKMEALQGSIRDDLSSIERQNQDLLMERNALLQERDHLKSTTREAERALQDAKSQWESARLQFEDHARRREKDAADAMAARWEERFEKLQSKVEEEKRQWGERGGTPSGAGVALEEERLRWMRQREEEMLAQERRHRTEMDKTPGVSVSIQEAPRSFFETAGPAQQAPPVPGMFARFGAWLNQPVLTLVLGADRRKQG